MSAPHPIRDVVPGASAASAANPFLTAQGALEDGVVIGNHFDKYGSRNPIVRKLMGGFAGALEGLVARTGARSIHEVGCGEGYWTLHWARKGYAVRGSDFSAQVIDVARTNGARDKSPAEFRVASVYDLAAPPDSAPLVICCEVLEHVEEPRRALERLCEIASPWLIVSVPREPLWRAMNMARGRYWSALGNTPGHIQHWSRASFCKLLADYVEPVEVRSPLPWTMVLCRRRG
jgi:SAM-dependent methyltransferase